MSKMFFVLTFSIAIISFTIAVHEGFTEDLKLLEWPEINHLPGSVWADTYAAKQRDTYFPIDMQIVVQSLAEAHSDRRGNGLYTQQFLVKCSVVM